MPAPKSHTFFPAELHLIRQTYLLPKPKQSLQHLLSSLTGQEILSLAEQTNLHPRTLWKIKNNRSQRPGQKVLASIACAMGIEPSEAKLSFPFHLNQANIQVLYQQNYTTKEIAQILSVSERFVSATISNRGLANRGGGYFQRVTRIQRLSPAGDQEPKPILE
jgi:hypothetical protein